MEEEDAAPSFCCTCRKATIQPENSLPDHINDCLKFSLSAFNMFYWVVGLFLIGCGIWAMEEKNAYKSVSSSLSTDPAIVVIVTGVVVLIISFIGMIGTLRENKTLLNVYEGMMVAVVILELLAVLFTAIAWPKIREKLDTQLLKAVENYMNDIDLQNAIDSIQKNFNCCGINNLDDWDVNKYMKCKSPSMWQCSVPYSCCKSEVLNIQCGFQVREKHRLEVANIVHISGCLDVVLEWFEDNYLKLCAYLVAIIFIPEMIGIVMTHVLRHQIDLQVAVWKQYQVETEEQPEPS